MFIDIHTHIMFDVDDGSQDMETSLLMLQKEVSDGTEAVILTPHVQSRPQKVERSVHHERFLELKKRAEEEGIKIDLYLGAEVLYRSHLEPDWNELALAGTKYVLLEFSMQEHSPVEDVVYDVTRMRFIPIVAHVERYPYVDFDLMRRIKDLGAWIQVNATSILGLDKKVHKKHPMKMLKEGLVDVIASDTHHITYREPNLLDCYTYLKKYFPQEELDAWFYTNPKKILSSITKQE